MDEFEVALEQVGKRGSGKDFVDTTLRFSKHAAEHAVVESLVGDNASWIVSDTFLQRKCAFNAIQDSEQVDIAGRTD